MEFTSDQIIGKMMEMFSDHLYDPEHCPLLAKHQHTLAKLELSLNPNQSAEEST